MKKLNLFLKLSFLLFFTISNVDLLTAQTDCAHPNGGDFCFEEVLDPCEQNGAFYWPFNDGCIPGWISANGNPDHRLASDFGPLGPEFGEFIASMQTTNSNGSNGCRNEALFLELDLATNADFTLSFSHRTMSNSTNWPAAPINVRVFQTFGMTVSNGWAGTAPCSNLSIPAGSELIFETDNFMAADFQQELVSFTSINQPGWGLLFVPEIHTQNNGQQWLLDLVCVRESGLTAACDEEYTIQDFEWDNDDCPEMLCIREVLDNGSLGIPTNPTLLVNWTSSAGPIAGITNGTCMTQDPNVFADHEGATITAFISYNDGACLDTLTFDMPICSTLACDEEYTIQDFEWDDDACPEMLCIRESGTLAIPTNPTLLVQWVSSGGPIAGITNGTCMTQDPNVFADHEGATITAFISYNDGACLDTLTFQMPVCTASDCDGTDFNDGTLMNWQPVGTGATVQNVTDPTNNFDGTPFMQVTDEPSPPSSRVFNEVDFVGINNGMLCFDLEIIEDLGGTETPEIIIYSGTMPNNIGLEATFTANFTMNENSGQVNICAPIIPSTVALPAGAQGTWSITSGTGNDLQDWNNLINNINGIAVLPEIVAFRGEIFRYDNICFTPCSDPNANCPVAPSCSCDGLTNNCLFLDVEGTPQDCETLFANISGACLPSDLCLEQIDWRVQLGGAFDETFTNQGAGFSWNIPPFGFYGFTVVVTATVTLADGQVCEIASRTTLECSGQFKGGRRDSVEGSSPFDEKIRLFPNPAQSEISIFNPFDKIVVAKIYNTNGQQSLATTLAPNSTSRLQLTDFSNGVYIVHFIDQTTNENLSTEKLILVN